MESNTQVPCSGISGLSGNNYSEHCIFARNNCASDDGFVNYVIFLYCTVADGFLGAGLFLLALWMVWLFIALAVTADNFFCSTLEAISQSLNLSQNVAGVTLLAFGNGAPDIFSSISALSDGDSEGLGLVLGALFGAGLFVTTVVFASVTLANPFRLNHKPHLRDLTFYLAAAYWAFTIAYYKTIDLYQALGFVLLYVVYVLVVLIGRRVNTALKKRGWDLSSQYSPVTLSEDCSEEEETDESMEYSILPVKSWIKHHQHHELERHDTDLSEGGINSHHSNPSHSSGREGTTDDEMTSLLGESGEYRMSPCNVSPVRHLINGILPLRWFQFKQLSWYNKILEVMKMPILILLGITIPLVDYEDRLDGWNKPLHVLQCITGPLFIVFAIKQGTVMINDVFPVSVVVLSLGIVLAVVVFFITDIRVQPRYHSIFAYFGFLVALVWIYSIANELVNVLQTIGYVLGLSQTVLGLTLLAWGNSIGDLVANTAVSRQGYPRMAGSACFGGPMFNLLMGIGISNIIATIKKGGPIIFTIDPLPMVLYSALTTSLLSSFIILPALKFRATKFYAIYLLILYACALTLVLVLEFKYYHPV